MPDDRTDQGGNYWTLFTPGIWKDLHAVLQSKASRVFALVVRMGLVGIAVVIAGLGYRYVMEAHPTIHAGVQVSMIDRIVMASPNLIGSPESPKEELWLFGILTSVITLLVLRRILAELTRAEGRNRRGR